MEYPTLSTEDKTHSSSPSCRSAPPTPSSDSMSIFGEENQSSPRANRLNSFSAAATASDASAETDAASASSSRFIDGAADEQGSLTPDVQTPPDAAADATAAAKAVTPLPPPTLAPPAALPPCAPRHVNRSPFRGWNFEPFLGAPLTDRPTLVLDVDETLLHASVAPMPDADRTVVVHRPAGADGRPPHSYEVHLRYRPGLGEFLRYCVDNWEVVVFTAGRPFYAAALLAQVERDFPFFHVTATPSAPSDVVVLHRDHCTPTSNGFVKDLFLLGRDLGRTLLVDNTTLSGAFQPYNLIKIANFIRYANAAPAPSAVDALDGAATPAAAAPVCAGYTWSSDNDTALRSLQRTILAELVGVSDFPRYLYSQRARLTGGGGSNANASSSGHSHRRSNAAASGSGINGTDNTTGDGNNPVNAVAMTDL